MIEPNSFVQHYARHDQLLAEANDKNMSALFETLAGTPVTRIHVSFAGAGNSGQIADVTVYAGDTIVGMPARKLELQRASWGSYTLQPSVQSLESAVEDLCYDLLEHYHGGWENNDGACGQFEIDVGKLSVALEFNPRFTESTQHQHTIAAVGGRP
jgi:hypothetical protein